MVKSKHQLLPLYNDVLQPNAFKGTVHKLCHEGVLQVDVIQQQLVSDVHHVILAVVVVFAAIWIHTGSFFLTSMGMLHVLMAFPSAYTFYTLVLGVHWMPLLNYIGIFVAIGIGADDIFVYTDAWRQGKALLPAGCPLDVRISWTLRRAGSAMFLTSFTTSAAFFTNIVNYVVPMQLFGLFMGLMVIFDYIYTVTWFPCAVAVYHVHIEPNSCMLWGKLARTFPALTRLCTRQQLGVAGGGAVDDSNSLYGNTPDVSLALDSELVGHPSSSSSAETVVKTFDDPVAANDGGGGEGGVELRRVEKMFRDVIAPRVQAARLPIIAAVAVLTVPFAYYMFSLELDEGGIQPFPKAHDQRQYMDISALDGVFQTPPGSHPRGMNVNILYGMLEKGPSLY